MNLQLYRFRHLLVCLVSSKSEAVTESTALLFQSCCCFFFFSSLSLIPKENTVGFFFFLSNNPEWDNSTGILCSSSSQSWEPRNQIRRAVRNLNCSCSLRQRKSCSSAPQASSAIWSRVTVSRSAHTITQTGHCFIDTVFTFHSEWKRFGSALFTILKNIALKHFGPLGCHHQQTYHRGRGPAPGPSRCRGSFPAVILLGTHSARIKAGTVSWEGTSVGSRRWDEEAGPYLFKEVWTLRLLSTQL